MSDITSSASNLPFNILHQHEAHLNLNGWATFCHDAAIAHGWWRGPRNFGEMIALMHSELSEALEGHRRSLPSDHIFGFSMVEEEFADTLIRLFDCAGAMKLRLQEAVSAKIAFNLSRSDHSPEARAKADGKKY